MKDQLITPQEIRDQIWKELRRATQDRHHDWRTPVFATSGLSSAVNARTVVLRAVDSKANKLQIYTDARSSKASEIAIQEQAIFVFWSSKLSWQLKVQVKATLITSGSQIQQTWAQVKQTASAKDYLSSFAPGTSVPSDRQTGDEDQTFLTHFAIVNAEIVEIDWLELARSGHRRAKISHDSWDWLVP